MISPFVDLVLSAGIWGGWIVTGGLLLGIIWAYQSGRVIPSGQHQDLKDQLEAIRADRNFWRDHVTKNLLEVTDKVLDKKVSR